MYIYIGRIVNTHGLKGEVRILSDFKYKEKVFKIGMPIYIGNDKTKEIINTYRVHKNYDMVTLNGLSTIEDVIIYKGEDVYINREDIKEDLIFTEDLINLDVYDNDILVGKVKEIIRNEVYEILVVYDCDKKYMIPNISEFIKKYDIEEGKIYIENIRGLIDED